jgi:hypothetical protein
MSRYAVKRTSDKIDKKVSDLYFNIAVHRSFFCLLEVCQHGYKRNTAFELGQVWMDWKNMEFRGLSFRGIDICELFSLFKEQY